MKEKTNFTESDEETMGIEMSADLLEFLCFVWKNLNKKSELSEMQKCIMFAPIGVTACILEKFEPDAKTIKFVSELYEDFKKKIKD